MFSEGIESAVVWNGLKVWQMSQGIQEWAK